MALGTPSESPAVVVKEIDLTGGVPNVQSTTGAIAGNFRWGPVDQRVLVDNEATLVDTFATPDSDNTIDFHSATYFLRYSGSLQVVRAVDSSALNSRATTGQLNIDSDNSLSTPIIKNENDFLAQKANLDIASHTLIAKYPGELGNGLEVSVCPADGTLFSAWPYNSSFDKAPSTSSYATARSAQNDEIHIAVVDKTGAFTGTAGTVVETFPYVSQGKNALNPDGTNNYAADVVNSASEYVWLAHWDGDLSTMSNAGTAASGTAFGNPSAAITKSLTGGVDSAALTTAEVATGFDLYQDTDTIQVDFLIAPGMANASDQATVVNDLAGIAGVTRKDCIVVTSPDRAAVVNNSTPVASSVTTAAGFNSSSYIVVDNNYLKVYDKFNDQYIFIPAASTTAGVMAATDANAAPWFSPAGQRRGQYFGVTALAYSPTKSERDTLYKAGLNPVANIPGQGILLFGDKTFLNRPSAFDRVNVRRLFLVMERAIASAARNVMFEFNDEFTRAEFTNIVEPFLREIQGRRGITDFKVVCDATNNGAAVIDRNEFIANIFVKPARSINYVTLNFVAVRTGVDFEEVAGTV